MDPVEDAEGSGTVRRAETGEMDAPSALVEPGPEADVKEQELISEEDVLVEPLECQKEAEEGDVMTEKRVGDSAHDDLLKDNWRVKSADLVSEASEDEDSGRQDDLLPEPIEDEEEGNLRRKLLSDEGCPRTSDAYLAVRLKLTGLSGKIPIKIERSSDFMDDKERAALVKEIKVQLDDLEKRWMLTKPPLKAFLKADVFPSFESLDPDHSKRKRKWVPFKYRGPSFKKARTSSHSDFDGELNDPTETEDQNEEEDIFCPDEPYCPLEMVGAPVSTGFLSIILKRTGLEPRKITSRNLEKGRQPPKRKNADNETLPPIVSSSGIHPSIKTRELREIKSALEILLEENVTEGVKSSARSIVDNLIEEAVSKSERECNALLDRFLEDIVLEAADQAVVQSSTMCLVEPNIEKLETLESGTQTEENLEAEKRIIIFDIPSVCPGFKGLEKLKVWIVQKYPTISHLETINESAFLVDLGSRALNEALLHEFSNGKPLNCRFWSKVISCDWASSVDTTKLGVHPLQKYEKILSCLANILENDEKLAKDGEDNECCQCCNSYKCRGSCRSLFLGGDSRELKQKRFQLKESFREVLQTVIKDVAQSNLAMPLKVKELKVITSLSLEVVNALRVDSSAEEHEQDDDSMADYGEELYEEKYMKSILDDALIDFLLPLTFNSDPSLDLESLMLECTNEKEIKVIKTSLTIWKEPVILGALQGQKSLMECARFKTFLPAMLSVLEDNSRFEEALNLAKILDEDQTGLRLCLKLEKFDQALEYFILRTGNSIKAKDLVMVCQTVSVTPGITPLTKFEIAIGCLRRVSSGYYRGPDFEVYSKLLGPLLQLVRDNPEISPSTLELFEKRQTHSSYNRLTEDCWNMFTARARSLSRSQDMSSELSRLAISAIATFLTLTEFFKLSSELNQNPNKRLHLLLGGLSQPALLENFSGNEECQEDFWKFIWEEKFTISENKEAKIIDSILKLVPKQDLVARNKLWEKCHSSKDGQTLLKRALSRKLLTSKFRNLCRKETNLSEDQEFEALIDFSLGDKDLLEVVISVVRKETETRGMIPPRIFFSRMSEAIDVFPEFKQSIIELLLGLIRQPNSMHFWSELLPFCDELSYAQVLTIATENRNVKEVQDFVLSSYGMACLEFPGLKENGTLDMTCKHFFKAAPGKFLAIMMGEAGELACDEAINIVKEMVGKTNADFKEIRDCIGTLLGNEDLRAKGIRLLQNCFAVAPWQMFALMLDENVMEDPIRALQMLTDSVREEGTNYDANIFTNALTKINEKAQAWRKSREEFPATHFALVVSLFERHPEDFLDSICPMIDGEERADSLATCIIGSVKNNPQWGSRRQDRILDLALRKIKSYPEALKKLAPTAMDLFYMKPREFIPHVIYFFSFAEVNKTIAFLHDNYFTSMMATRDPEFFVSLLLVGAFNQFPDSQIAIIKLLKKVLRQGCYLGKMAKTILQSPVLISRKETFHECLNALAGRREPKESVENIEDLCSALIAISRENPRVASSVSSFMKAGANELREDLASLNRAIEAGGNQWRRSDKQVPGCKTCKVVNCEGRSHLIRFLLGNEQKQSLTGNAMIRKCITRLLTSSVNHKKSYGGVTLQRLLNVEFQEITADENMRQFGTRRCGGIVVTKHRTVSVEAKNKVEQLNQRMMKWMLFVGKIEGILDSRITPPNVATVPLAPKLPRLPQSPLHSSHQGYDDDIVILTPVSNRTMECKVLSAENNNLQSPD